MLCQQTERHNSKNFVVRHWLFKWQIFDEDLSVVMSLESSTFLSSQTNANEKKKKMKSDVNIGKTQDKQKKKKQKKENDDQIPRGFFLFFLFC